MPLDAHELAQLTAALADINKRLTALENATPAAALQAGVPPAVDESLQATYITVNAQGQVGALFTGGIQMNEQTEGQLLNPADAVTWVGSSGTFYEAVWGAHLFENHYLGISCQTDTLDQALLYLQSGAGGEFGGSNAQLFCQDSTGGNGATATLYDSQERSSFLQGGYYSTTDFVQPTRALNTAYTPNANRPTLVIATLNLLPGAVGSAFVNVQVGGETVAQPLVGGGIPNTCYLCVTFLVPAGSTYEFVNESQVGASVGVQLVTELAL